MIIKEILCDRCCKKIKDDHPVRISIEEYQINETSIYGAKTKGYRSKRKLHFCKKCDDAFVRFIQGGES